MAGSIEAKPAVDGVGRVEPAVGVHDVAWHRVRHAVDRAADELPGKHLDGQIGIIEFMSIYFVAIKTSLLPRLQAQTLRMQLYDSVCRAAPGFA